MVDMLPRHVGEGRVVVGYADGKVETVSVAGEGRVGGSRFPRVRRKQEEVMSVAELVERVDAWARVLKGKEQGV